MTSSSPHERQLARLIESGQFPEALEFCRAHTPSPSGPLSYLVLACHAALGSGEIAYATMWAKAWTKANPQDPNGLRLYYSALLEEQATDEALDCLRALVRIDPGAPERIELIQYLANNNAQDEALQLISSAPKVDVPMALIAHELTLDASQGPKNVDTRWLVKAEAIAPFDHRVVLARYRMLPSLENGVQAISKLKQRPNASDEFDTVQIALRIIAAHPELKPTSWLAALEALESSVAAQRAMELALLWETFGEDERAKPHLEATLVAQPSNELAALTLSRLHLRNDRADEAFQVLTPIPRDQLFKSYQLVKQMAEVAIHLRRYEIALAAQQVVVKHRPEDPDEKIRLAQLYNFNGLYEDELQIYDECIAYEKTRLASTLLRTFSTPRIYTSEAQLETVRDRIIQYLPDFKKTTSEYLTDRCEELHRALADHTNFSIGYQQYNDIEIQKSFGEVLHSVNTTLFSERRSPTTKATKPHIAFYTHFTWNHTVGKLFHRWMTGLSDLGFNVAVVSNSKTHDHITQRIKDAVSTFEVTAPTLRESIQTLRALSPDVVIFPELGMGPLSLGTAATRNAPIQCMAWGHPITSGLPTMDYFLSSELMEPSNGQEHYSEELVRLPGLSIEFEAPTLPNTPHTKAQLGLPENRVLLLSCQTLYKLLPRYDQAYVDILKSAPSADLVFIGNRSRYITEQFKHRLETIMTQNGIDTSRLHIVGPLPHDAYLSLNLMADVFLDAHGWSGGNTTLEALRTNLPIVTTPGEFMRGRHSAAILQQLGLKEFIATSIDEWTKLAIAYAKDAKLREAHAIQIRDASEKAYRDPRIIEALAEKLTSIYNGQPL